MVQRFFSQFPILFILVTLSSCLTSPEVIPLQDNALKKAKVLKTTGFKADLLQISLMDYTIAADSYGNLKLKNDELRTSLDLGEGFYTHDVHFIDNEDSIILFFEITDDAGLYNKAFSIDKTTFKTLWETDLGHFKLSVGEAENKILYLAAADNVYALDLRTGNLLWQTNGLYFQHGIYYFDNMSIEAGSIKLIGRSRLQPIKERKIATIDKNTGKIISLLQ